MTKAKNPAKIEKLQSKKTVNLYVESTQEMKYDMPKVLKAKFNEEPDRYEFRKGFPDSPACPYGGSFTGLGYDRKENKYVWLVSSILKDKRLVINEYK